MEKLSAVTFVHNEGDKIGKSLECLRPYVEEIIVFDLESTDNTNAVAREFTSEVFTVPHLLCGDSYKMELAHRAQGSWLLWFYPDEVFVEKTCKAFEKLIEQTKWNSYSFMRHEYLDGVRMGFGQDGEVIQYGTIKCPNYQNRLHRKDGRIFYTEFVHAELHGEFVTCGLPPEFYFEHQKTNKDQTIDNVRTFIWMKGLVWKYGSKNFEPYKTFVESYKHIVRQSEEKNLSGEREVHMAEELWWNWRQYINEGRIKLGEFEERTGLSYVEFLKRYSVTNI